MMQHSARLNDSVITWTQYERINYLIVLQQQKSYDADVYLDAQ